MTESAAICQYLAERFDPHNIKGLAVRPNEPGFGAWLNGLHQGEATLTFPQTIVLRYGHFEPDERKLPQAAEDYTKWFLSRLRWIDAVLQDNEFLCAGRFTAADISVGYALMLAGSWGCRRSCPPPSPPTGHACSSAKASGAPSPRSTRRRWPRASRPRPPPLTDAARQLITRRWISTTRCSRPSRCRSSSRSW